MRGNCHDCARTVTHHNVVGNIDRNFLAVCGVDRGKSFNANTGLILNELCTFKLGLLRTFFFICIERFDVCDTAAVFFNDGMFGRNNHEGYAEHGITSGGINTERILTAREREVCKRAFGSADPVFLLKLDIGEIIHLFKSLQELVCVFRDSQIPNVFRFLNDIAVADIAFTALRVFIGKNDLTVRAIVYESGCAEHKTFVKHFAEDPLCPFVVVFVRGIDNTGPIKGKADFFKLGSKLFNIFIRQNTGMGVEFDCGVFRGQTESVKADREKNVIALHSFLSGNYFKSGIRLDVTDVHTGAAGVREFNQSVEFRKRIIAFCFKRMIFFPCFLPFCFNGLKIVRHGLISP